MEKLIAPKSNPNLLPKGLRIQPNKVDLLDSDLGSIWVRFEFQYGCESKYRITPLDSGIIYVTIIHDRCA